MIKLIKMRFFVNVVIIFSVKLHAFKDPPPKLRSLLESYDETSAEFRQNLRAYNNMVSMASKAITGKMTEFKKWPRPFKMSGSMYHLTPHIFPEKDQKPKFSQIYVYDVEHELSNRLEHIREKDRINKMTLETIQNELKVCNFYVRKYHSAAEMFKANPEDNLRMVFKSKGSLGTKKKDNMPQINDVVVIAPGEQTEPRDIVLYRSRKFCPDGYDAVRINELHKAYDPTAYALILPHGDDGFSIPPPLKEDGKHQLSINDFYIYHLMIRSNSFNALHRCGRLYQEYLCDQYSKIEGARLKYIRGNQDKLRVEQYAGLQDHVANLQSGTEDPKRVGQMVVLPATFTGSPRFMYKHYMDALAICREYRKFDFFITITGNPKWNAVLENLFPGQTTNDRPDIMNRVFHEVLRNLINDIKIGVLGPLKARLHTIEGNLE